MGHEQIKKVRLLGLGATAIMVVALAVAFATGDFASEGSQILGLPWGRMSLVDLYIGAALIGGWIAHRERSWPRILAWWLALIVLGHLASAIYVVAAAKSTDWTTFWSGSNASSVRSDAR
ncbi:MAG: DUF1475 domain-containing protein [Acidimicrobiia bacterium]|nr:DUF1475 domain-containing protein [Acidimicrobiia bacterium]